MTAPVAEETYSAVKVKDGFRSLTEIKGPDMKHRKYYSLSMTVS